MFQLLLKSSHGESIYPLLQSTGRFFFWIQQGQTQCCFPFSLLKHTGHESMELQSNFMISWGACNAFVSMIKPFFFVSKAV